MGPTKIAIGLVLPEHHPPLFGMYGRADSGYSITKGNKGKDADVCLS